MARIRTIKPEFWLDYSMAAELTRDQRLFYIALWNEADDEGRVRAHPRRLLGVVFPYEDDLTEQWVDQTLDALVATGRAVRYSVNGEPYLELTKFGDHQKINRPSESHIPPPDSDLAQIHGAISEPSSPEQGTGNREMEQGSISSPDGDSSESADADTDAMVARLWEVFLDELGGAPPHPRMTKKRRGRLLALYREHLRRHDDPAGLFRAVLQEVQRSEWHMGKREYQMPESLFLNPERRDRWVQKALKPTARASPGRRSSLAAHQGDYHIEGDENAAA